MIWWPNGYKMKLRQLNVKTGISIPPNTCSGISGFYKISGHKLKKTYKLRIICRRMKDFLLVILTVKDLK